MVIGPDRKQVQVLMKLALNYTVDTRHLSECLDDYVSSVVSNKKRQSHFKTWSEIRDSTKAAIAAAAAAATTVAASIVTETPHER